MLRPRLLGKIEKQHTSSDEKLSKSNDKYAKSRFIFVKTKNM
jgi:hypothetical protein